ncbi:MAG: copper-binding protein [Limisphaerales bacterium]
MKCLTVLCVLLLVHPLLAAPTGGDQGTKSYSARGVVEKIAPDLSHITIHHQAIPGYMMEMTMDFTVKNTNELSGISPGDEITFTLVGSSNDEWVENIHRIGHSAETTTNGMSMPMNMSGSMMMPELKPGDLLPDYTLTAEDGKQIHLSDFRGKVLAFTFFFTRCPLPDYCPRMNNNFEETRKILLADANAPTNWQFLSISFDPGFDTPEVLANYAGVYRGDDTNRWLFASAPTNVLADAAVRLDLMVMRQGNNISHNLRTVVLDTAGRIYKQFDGNQWTPQQLADAIVQAARSSNR